MQVICIKLPKNIIHTSFNTGLTFLQKKKKTGLTEKVEDGFEIQIQMKVE